MNKKKALKAYSYNEKVFLTKNKNFIFNLSDNSDFNEKVFNKAIDLIVRIAIESTKVNNNPLVSQTGIIASLLSKSLLESSLSEEEKIELIYNLELDISYSKFKKITYNSEDRIEFYKAADSFNSLIKDYIDVKEAKELRMLINNILKVEV